MGWSVGFDSKWDRDIGYGVPATCDYPRCGEEIDRGLGYVCGGQPLGGENGCGLYFCDTHLPDGAVCERCLRGEDPFEPTPDTAEWISWKLTDEYWGTWRDEHQAEVEAMQAALAAGKASKS